MSEAAKQLKGRAARLARLMPAGPSTAARTPFVLLVVVLLGGGLITLLLLNSSLNEGSFELSELKRETTELTDEQQALQRDVDSYSAPDALERRARELGMVPGGNPAFIDPDGTVRGVPGKATARPSPAPSPLEIAETPLPATEPTPSPVAVPAAPSTATASSAPVSGAQPPGAVPRTAPDAPDPAALTPSNPPAKPTPTPPGR
ncbi:FtsB family cell division protein [Streptomyces sp. AM8-1-1]|uniref:FtsB family cell division protein n=1 Tax=Streptomyces sp. AM8-1-1 TaxID=3075825 RepID=UPI0028C424D7|nr:septum formation initiator family protein [Streptomyces sp. AM8-1-1]WNO75106.1 septum formation initiator family protein [Streptomyces sp. AM8-1-1]